MLAGASGLIGRALGADLAVHGHAVTRLVRREPASVDEVKWDPSAGRLDPTALAGADAVVNLAGAGVGDHRWTPAYKRTILRSRVDSTELIARTIADLADRPAILLNASAIGWYGDTADREVDESAPAGEGFLADVVRQWESATAAASAAGTRVVHLRTGLVVARAGGAWARMFPLFRLGLGGRLGSGRQYWSWISLRDHVAATRFCLTDDTPVGPVNLTAPIPVTNAEVTAAMRRVLRRPAFLPVPAFALTLALGEFSTEVLSSSRVVPAALTSAGFGWQDVTIDDAIRSALAS